MSTDGQGTLRRRNIAENFNRLSRVHQRYRQTTDRRTMTYSERELEFTFAKNCKFYGYCYCIAHLQVTYLKDDNNVINNIIQYITYNNTTLNNIKHLNQLTSLDIKRKNYSICVVTLQIFLFQIIF